MNRLCLMKYMLTVINLGLIVKIFFEIYLKNILVFSFSKVDCIWSLNFKIYLHFSPIIIYISHS